MVERGGCSGYECEADDRGASPDVRVTRTVEKVEWVCEHPLSWAELEREALRRSQWPKKRWDRVLWHGGVHLGRARVCGAQRPGTIAAGTRIRVYGFESEPQPVEISRANLILVTPDVVAANKPSGLPVQGTRASTRHSLETQLVELLGGSWITPVHRLDMVTSGVNLFARSPKAARFLGDQFSRRQVTKLYVAWVSPPPSSKRWCVRAFLAPARHPQHATYRVVKEGETSGKLSETRFQTLSIHGDLALVCAEPVTGRTHQIRVHLAFGGTPIVGDTLYGGASPQGGEAERPLLHARSLRLYLPGDSEPRRIRAKPPVEFADFTRRTVGGRTRVLDPS